MCWRSLLIATALNVTVCGMAAAQTVAVTSAPAGAKIEAQIVQRSGTSAGSGTADESGIVSIPIQSEGKLLPTGIDANVFVDVCGSDRRIFIVERGAQLPPSAEGCDRRDVSGLYWVRPSNTIVVNATATSPSVLLIKGAYTPRPPSEETAVSKPRRSVPTGLALYGGVSRATFSNAVSSACGNVGGCTGNDAGIGFAAGGVYWITRVFGLEAGYIRPPKPTATADVAPVHFNTTLDADVVRLAGDVAIPAGPVRVYGFGGVSFHEATTSTTQTNDPTTVVVDGVDQTIPGGTQSFGLRTQGWSWTTGGGVEVWPTNRWAIYGEFVIAKLKGSATGGVDASIDDQLAAIVAGVRFRVGRK